MKKTFLLLAAITAIMLSQCTNSNSNSKSPTESDIVHAKRWFKLKLVEKIASQQIKDERFRSILGSDFLSSWDAAEISKEIARRSDDYEYSITDFNDLSQWDIVISNWLDKLDIEYVTEREIEIFKKVWNEVPRLDKLRFTGFKYRRDYSDNDYTFFYESQSKDFTNYVAIIKKIKKMDGTYETYSVFDELAEDKE
jgi:hypothetical protein